jgi:hypothetical protein
MTVEKTMGAAEIETRGSFAPRKGMKMGVKSHIILLGYDINCI